jgi:signal transduction histidine kinase
MLRMTSDILSMEAIQRRLEEAPREVLDLRQMVIGLLRDIEPEAQRRGQRLHVSLPAGPVPTLADPANLPEAITNLLSNAIKYTPDGGQIDVRLRVEGQHVLFEVEDTGYGIPADKQERLFQPFYRAKTDATAHIEGTGLGLYLVKKIVEQHGGTMRFRSEPGVGSLFGFELPLAEASA